MSNKVVVSVDVKSPIVECGQMFIKDDEVYILCCVDVLLYSLIRLEDGYRWCDPLSLDKIGKIIISDGLTPIGNIKITIDKE